MPNSLEPINFVNVLRNMPVYDALIACFRSDYDYVESATEIAKYGYWIPEDQFNAFKRVLVIQLDLALGKREE
jgi:hypothetical protein